MGCTSSVANIHGRSLQEKAVFDTRSKSTSFITASNSSLYLDDEPFRFASLCAPDLLKGTISDPFETIDTLKTLSIQGSFGRPVTRTYTLEITSKNVETGDITGWDHDKGDWIWNEKKMLKYDVLLDQAAKFGVKLIIPIINQDYGGEDTNWVGNFRDLIRFRKGLAYEQAKQIDWFRDREMIDSFKLLITHLFNRINTINQKRFGADSAILAWETGNEMNELGYRGAPGNWTVEIAEHMKSLAPNTLVMDGSFARTNQSAARWEPEVLNSPFVDILSYHYYGDGDISTVKDDISIVRKAGKIFIAGEYGFFKDSSNFEEFLKIVDKAGGSGSLAWGFRPHSIQGGFVTHGEGDGIWSYHAPGWSNATGPEFDPRERDIMAAVRKHSYKINKEKVPDWPIPSAPSRAWFLSPTYLTFLGSPWTERYAIVANDLQNGSQISHTVYDYFKEGRFAIDLSAAPFFSTGCPMELEIRALGVDGSQDGSCLKVPVGPPV